MEQWGHILLSSFVNNLFLSTVEALKLYTEMLKSQNMLWGTQNWNTPFPPPFSETYIAQLYD